MLTFAKKHKTITLILGDILMLYFSLFATLFVRNPSTFSRTAWFLHFYPFSTIFFFWLIVFYFNGLYEIITMRDRAKLLKKLFQSILINVSLAIIFFYLAMASISPKRNLFFVVVFFIIFFYLWRNVFYLFIKSSLARIKIGFVGLNQEVKEVISEINNNPQLGYEIIFILALKDDERSLKNLPKNLRIYRGLGRLDQILQQRQISQLIVAMEPETNPVLAKELYHSSSKIEFIYFPNFYEAIAKKVPLQMINRLWLQQKINGQDQLYRFLKRLSDILLAVIGGMLTGILSLPLIIFYILSDGYPMLFSQTRIGKDNKKFKILKFRTMVKGAERKKPLWAEENDERVTRFGRFLRKYYIDELPQFINILKGEMSVVGPRPERPEFIRVLEKEIAFYSMRHIVRPGVTGWAQISSFYARSIDDSIEKTKYDLYYVKNRSLLFDFDILLRTIKMVFSKRAKQNY